MGEFLVQPRLETAPDMEDVSGRAGELISLLQQVQIDRGFISEDSVQEIARILRISEAHVYGVASFYSQFRFEKPAQHNVRICLGTACHVQGGAHLSQEIQNLLGIGPGEVTPDRRFDLREVACLGCCAQAPVVEIDGKIFGKMTRDKLRRILEKYEEL